MKNRIVVAEPMSTAFGFLEDIRQRGMSRSYLNRISPKVMQEG